MPVLHTPSSAHTPNRAALKIAFCNTKAIHNKELPLFLGMAKVREFLIPQNFEWKILCQFLTSVYKYGRAVMYSAFTLGQF
jgi:hypothetical protein